MLCVISLMYEGAISSLNCTEREYKKTQIAVYVFNTAVTLKEGQDHQTWYESVDPKQAYNHAA